MSPWKTRMFSLVLWTGRHIPLTSQENLWQWYSTYCSYVLRTWGLITRCHLQATLHPSYQSGTFGVYAWWRFPYHNTSQHSSQPSSLTLYLKPPLSSSRTIVHFHPLTFPKKPPKYLGYHCFILPRIHPLFVPLLCDIGDLLYIVYHLSHHYTIRMCYLPTFL